MMRTGNAKPPVPRGHLAIASAIALGSMILALGGCAVGPDFVTPQAEVNDTWNEAGDRRVGAQAAVNSRWWGAFGDPTLDRLIEQAYQQNLPLQIAGLRIMEARARLGIAIGLQYPQLQEAFASATTVGVSRNAANTTGLDPHFGDYQIGFDAAWELDFWGRFRRGVEAEAANLIASVADYDDSLVSLTAEVARTYVVIRTFEVLIELTSENAKVQTEGLEIAESRFRNGATTELDVTQARSLLESTKATIPQLEIGLQQAFNALSTLLGQPTGDIQALLEGPKGIPTAPAKVAVGVPAELLRRRPDIRSAELVAAAQSARIGIAKADLYPRFALVGDIGFQTSSGNSAHFHNLMDGNSLFYSLGPQARWPILNYGRIVNNVRVEDARFQQAVVNYQNTVLTAAQEVEDALTGFLRSQDATVFEQNSVDASQRSVEIALTQYREGAVDYQRVLDTQRALLQEQNTLAQLRSSTATNLIALYKALGGGWELRRDQPVVPADIQAEMQRRTDWGNLLPPPPTPEALDPPPPAGETPLLEKPYW